MPFLHTSVSYVNFAMSYSCDSPMLCPLYILFCLTIMASQHWLMQTEMKISVSKYWPLILIFTLSFTWWYESHHQGKFWMWHLYTLLGVAWVSVYVHVKRNPCLVVATDWKLLHFGEVFKSTCNSAHEKESVYASLTHVAWTVYRNMAL